MPTSTLRIAIRSPDAPSDIGRLPDVLHTIEAALREDVDAPATLTADNMTIAIDMATDRPPEAAALLRNLALI